jgi:catechol 2,3-dioxygenase-like lactoylglutathione lyase family enzyme
MAKLDHLGLQVADRSRSTRWFVETLGLEVEFEIPEAGVTALRDDAELAIFLNETRAPKVEATLYFQVDSVDALYGTLAARGVSFVQPPQVNSWGYGAELLDPDGHVVRLWDASSMKEHEKR